MTPEQRAVIDAAILFAEAAGRSSIHGMALAGSRLEEAVKKLKTATSRQLEPATSDGDTGCPVSTNPNLETH